MSDEVKETIKADEIQHEMYVQQIEWDVFKGVIERVTNVNRLFMYNMPTKAEKYVEDIVNLIKTLDGYLTGEDDWRVTEEKNIRFLINKKTDTIEAGSWSFGKPLLILCIPKLNSFFIVPDSTATYKGSPSPTHIIQLSNCISIMPMLLTMNEVPDPEKEGVTNISMCYEMLNQYKEEEKPSE